MKGALLSVGVLFCILSSSAQDFPRTDFNLEKLVDEIFPIQDLDLNYEELYENLVQLLSNPLDLNTVTREQLRSLFVVTEEEVNAFLSYRNENGPLLSVYELQAVPGWDRNTFDHIIPFVTVYDSQSRLNSSILTRMLHEKNNYLLLRYERGLETKKGYRPETDSAQRYQGSPEKYYVRYRLARSNDFSFGVTAEKDPGETLSWSPSRQQYGFDYMSIHGQVQNKGRLKNLIAGDFQSQFGQGLILGSAFGFGKNSETVTTVRRANLGFLPYTSLNENLYFRGIAATLSLTPRWYVHAFASRTAKDASIDNNSDFAEASYISSFATSGLHRTPAEMQARKQIQESDAGAVLQFKNNFLDAGAVFFQTDFSRPVQRNRNPYNQFTFSGNQNQNAGLYLNVNYANFTFLTEAAQTLNHGAAWVAGLLGNITHRLEVSLLIRNFARNFYSFNANAFSENTLPQNEEGMYWGWKYRISRRYSASGYLDLFQFPWLRYRGYSPSEGREWLLRLNYTPSKTVSLFVQAREESKERNISEESTLYQNYPAVKRNFWINCDYTATPHFTFKTRLQTSSFSFAGQTTRGFTIIQDVNFSLRKWSVGARYALFDTDDYDNRLYVYERDVWLAYSFPAYYGVGVRNYVIVQYQLSSKMDLWLRWSRIQYDDRDEIGSGSETISGNTRNDLKFQLRIRI